jgi:hypothetical protein
MGMRRRLVFALWACVLCGVVSAQTSGKPNFTGEWQMDAAKSDFGKFPVPTAILRRIAQNGSELTIDTTQRASNGEQTARVRYRTDGGETTNQLPTGPATSHGFWDGQTLVIRTTMKGKSDIDVLMEERWDLSEDGKTLTTTSHIETSKGSTDLKLVCDKVK